MDHPRFFCSVALQPGQTIDLPPETAHHVKVRRVRVGEPVTLFDGQGHEATADVLFGAGETCRAKILAVTAVSRERAGHFTLVQGLASQDRMDWAIEKAVEAGVSRFVPVQANRSVSRLSDERSAKRGNHWRRLVQSASEQCGRNHLMDVLLVGSLPQAILSVKGMPLLLCALTTEAVSITDARVLEPIRAAGGVALMVGPEGGWDERETGAALAVGAIPVSLGSRVYRTETAGLAAVTTLGALLGW